MSVLLLEAVVDSNHLMHASLLKIYEPLNLTSIC